MKRSKLLLIVTLAAFVGWLGWLAVAVAGKDRTVPISRAQITAATSLAICDVEVDKEGLPVSKVKVKKVFKSGLPLINTEIEILNLRNAGVPGAGFPSAGTYLIPVVMVDPTTYTVAGLPRSPGYEATTTAKPVIYPWNSDIEKQLKTLGFE